MSECLIYQIYIYHPHLLLFTHLINSPSLIILLVVRVDNLSSVGGLLLPPVVGALGADKDEVHAVLGGVHERHRLVVAALLAREVLPARESRVLDALLVDVEEELGAAPISAAACRLVSSAARRLLLARPVHTVVCLVTRSRLLKVPADAAVVD